PYIYTLSLHDALPILLEANPVESVPLRHIGKNHLVSDLQTVPDFNRVHRTPPQLDIDAHGFRSVTHKLENSYRAVCLTIHRPSQDRKSTCLNSSHVSI